VSRKGAWAFQSRVPFTFDDAPAPPAGARLERARDGGLIARYPGGWGPLLVLAVLLLGAAAVGLGPSWPAFPAIDDALWLVRVQGWPLALLAAAVVATALFWARHRVRWLDTRGGQVRSGALGRWPRALAGPRIARVFAAEDFVMAQVEGSWIPEMLSPRLGSHGAALWLAAEVRKALGRAEASRW
jgi:hypothetical protein